MHGPVLPPFRRFRPDEQALRRPPLPSLLSYPSARRMSTPTPVTTGGPDNLLSGSAEGGQEAYPGDSIGTPPDLPDK
jgi:hypothetical protein